jgi:hypothetical protein
MVVRKNKKCNNKKEKVDMSENIDKMISSLITKDRDEFNTAFSSEIEDRIGTIISDKSLEISKDILDNDSQEQPDESPDPETKE